MSLNNAPLFFDTLYGQKHERVKYSELAALKCLLRERKTSYEKMAGVIGITPRIFTNKINGYYDAFDVLEMEKIAEYFDIDPANIVKYFFP